MYIMSNFIDNLINQQCCVQNSPGFTEYFRYHNNKTISFYIIGSQPISILIYWICSTDPRQCSEISSIKAIGFLPNLIVSSKSSEFGKLPENVNICTQYEKFQLGTHLCIFIYTSSENSDFPNFFVYPQILLKT